MAQIGNSIVKATKVGWIDGFVTAKIDAQMATALLCERTKPYLKLVEPGLLRP